MLICYQDFKSKSVYWILFPALATAFFIDKWYEGSTSTTVWIDILLNLGFLFIQLLLISLYFSIKYRSWTNIITTLLGLGDILFLVSIAFFFSPISFVCCYLGSLILSLALWLAWKSFTNSKSKQIPLAGLQAMILFSVLSVNWCFLFLNLTSDNWILRFVIK